MHAAMSSGPTRSGAWANSTTTKIRPKRGKFLAIPLTAQAYKAGSPGEGRLELFFIKRRGSRRGFLAQRDDGGALRLQYALLPRVVQDPDPRALPDMDALEAKLHQDTSDWIDRNLGGHQ